MSTFLSYIDHCSSGKTNQDRIDEIVLFMVDFFDSKATFEYFIVDPYFNVDSFLRQPFEQNTIEENIWSNLIATLSKENSSFSIITNLDSSLNREPTKIPFPENEMVSINACCYPNGKMYDNYKLHDRYVIGKGKIEIAGLHIGPSLSDIDNKDITITILEEKAAKSALENFKIIWEECKRTKGWATN